MVELRVINGGKLKEEEFSCLTVKLFSASSVVNNFRGHDGVKFNWFYVGRENPVAPYDRLICGYKCIDKRVRPYFEEHMNELFTEDELEALKAYLLKSPFQGGTLEACEEALPASNLFIPMPFFSGVPIGEGRGLYHPPEEEHSLPFKVAAYFDLRNCPASSTLTDDSKQNGINFLAEALSILGLRAGVSTIELESTVENLYASHGFHVQQESNRACDTKTEES
jgi:hypothetical protein